MPLDGLGLYGNIAIDVVLISCIPVAVALGRGTWRDHAFYFIVCLLFATLYIAAESYFLSGPTLESLLFVPLQFVYLPVAYVASSHLQVEYPDVEFIENPVNWKR